MRSHLLVGLLELSGHLVEGLFPADRLELAVFVEFAVLHTHQRLGDAVLAVLDLAVEIALDTVEALVDRGVRVTLGGHDAAIPGTDHDAAAGAAETAHTLVPLDVGIALLGSGQGGCRYRDAGCAGGGRGSTGLEKVSARQFHGGLLSVRC